MSTGVQRRGRGSGNQNKMRQLQGWGDELDAFWEEELQRRPEVRIINKYALAMAYIRFGIKGIGALALLWATVVLLGGFVSSIRMIDFWVLTIISFLQAAGVFEAMGDARFASFEDWLISLMGNINSWGQKHHLDPTQLPMREQLKRQLRILVLKIKDITLVVLFFPVAYFASAGPALCIVLSALRLANQDYGIIDGEVSKANLKRGLKLYYYVSLAHGAICLLCIIFEITADENLVVTISQRHGISLEILDGYLRETKQMCVNNPVSMESWNLITYGAGLLDSQLPEDYASGGRLLSMLIDQDISLIRVLIRSPRQRIQKLIGTLAWRSPAEREMRWFAARIVEHLAGHLNLAHFPGALECISSLFDTSNHNNGDEEVLHLPFVIGRSKPRKTRSLLDEIVAGKRKKDKDGNLKVPEGTISNIFHLCLEPIDEKYDALENGCTLEPHSKQRGNEERIDENLVLPGLGILGNLAHDRHNCTLIYNAKDLLSKIVSPISSNEFVQDIKSNAAWTKVVDRSLKVVSRLMSSPGSTGEEMRSLIANDRNAVNNLEAVLDIDMKSTSDVIELQMRVIEVLTQLALHHSASTSAMKRREKLIERVLHIFIATDWMEDYLQHEKKTIDQSTMTQQNTLSRPSVRTRLNNLVKEVNRTREKETMAKQAAEARAEKKMKAAQETASRLKEKAGEALAMLSSNSEANKSFTVCDDDVHCLTELLDSKIKTIKCKISATDIVQIEINMGCRISAAVILKHFSNYVKESTLRKVLAELLRVQAEASSTPQCWERFIPVCCKNDMENQMDNGQEEPFALQSHIQYCGERRLQAELLSLVAAIRASSNVNFPAVLISQTQPVALEYLVVRLKNMVEENMYATPACLAIQKLTCEMVTEFLQHDQNVEVIDKHNIVATLVKASKVMAGLESSMLFAGVDRDCHGVPLKPLSSVLAKNAEEFLAQRKQLLCISIAPVGSSSP